MFNDYAEMLAANFEKSMAYKGFDLNYLDTTNSKAKELFSNYINEFRTTSIPSIKKLNFRTIKSQEVFKHTFHYLYEKLPNHFTFPVFKGIMNITVQFEGESPLDGIHLSYIDTITKKESSIIKIPDLNKTSAITCLGHESVHNILEKNGLKSIKNYHYTEILSILFEMIINDMIETDKIEESMSNKMSLLRLDSIKFHSEYYLEILQIASLPELIHQAMCNNDLNELKKLKSAIVFEQHKSYMFLISYPYALYLFNIYKNNPEEFLAKIRLVFDGEIPIDGILNYYGIDFTKPEITSEPIKELKRIKKLSF